MQISWAKCSRVEALHKTNFSESSLRMHERTGLRSEYKRSLTCAIVWSSLRGRQRLEREARRTLSTDLPSLRYTTRTRLTCTTTRILTCGSRFRVNGRRYEVSQLIIVTVLPTRNIMGHARAWHENRLRLNRTEFRRLEEYILVLHKHCHGQLDLHDRRRIDLHLRYSHKWETYDSS